MLLRFLMLVYRLFSKTITLVDENAFFTSWTTLNTALKSVQMRLISTEINGFNFHLFDYYLDYESGDQNRLRLLRLVSNIGHLHILGLKGCFTYCYNHIA